MVTAFCALMISVSKGKAQGPHEARRLTSERLPTRVFSPVARPPTIKVAMSELYPSIAQCAVVATALKVLLFPA